MLDTLYENVGRQIKNVAKGLFLIEAVGSIIAGIVVIVEASLEPAIGLLITFFGPIIAFSLSLFVYGFGELIETNFDIRRKLYKADTLEEESANNYAARINEEAKRTALYDMRRVTAADLEQALSFQIMRKVSISEMDCTLVYVLTERGLPQEMHLELTVESKIFYSIDLILFDKDKKAYYYQGERLTLDERWLPEDEIFDFDLSLFKSFKTIEEIA